MIEARLNEVAMYEESNIESSLASHVKPWNTKVITIKHSEEINLFYIV